MHALSWTFQKAHYISCQIIVQGSTLIFTVPAAYEHLDYYNQKINKFEITFPWHFVRICTTLVKLVTILHVNFYLLLPCECIFMFLSLPLFPFFFKKKLLYKNNSHSNTHHTELSSVFILAKLLSIFSHVCKLFASNLWLHFHILKHIVLEGRVLLWSILFTSLLQVDNMKYIQAASTHTKIYPWKIYDIVLSLHCLVFLANMV